MAKQLVRLWERPSYDGKRFTYYLLYADEQGKRRQKSLGHANRRKAESQRAKLERKLVMGIVEPGSMKLKDFVEGDPLGKDTSVADKLVNDLGLEPRRHLREYPPNAKEGTHCYKSSRCEDSSYIDPVIEYDHDEGCSITGGYVYRGTGIPGLQGTYMYSDFCSGTLWGAKKQGNGAVQSYKSLDSGLNIASFAEGNDGELYVIHLQGEVYKIVAK